MTSILDRKARIVIPREIRDQLDLEPGDRVELKSQGKSVMLSKIKKSRNEGLVDLLLSCPVKDFPLERRTDRTRVRKF
jgi:AbrB family looped-hinge helix DNA binding protein